jgi:hypothetical protein
MSGTIKLLPQCASMAWCSVKKHRDNFTFNFNTQGGKTTWEAYLSWEYNVTTRDLIELEFDDVN